MDHKHELKSDLIAHRFIAVIASNSPQVMYNTGPAKQSLLDEV